MFINFLFYTFELLLDSLCNNKIKDFCQRKTIYVYLYEKSTHYILVQYILVNLYKFYTHNSCIVNAYGTKESVLKTSIPASLMVLMSTIASWTDISSIRVKEQTGLGKDSIIYS